MPSSPAGLLQRPLEHSTAASPRRPGMRLEEAAGVLRFATPTLVVGTAAGTSRGGVAGPFVGDGGFASPQVCLVERS